jgi:hypothetical protein
MKPSPVNSTFDIVAAVYIPSIEGNKCGNKKRWRYNGDGQRKEVAQERKGDQNGVMTRKPQGKGSLG